MNRLSRLIAWGIFLIVLGMQKGCESTKKSIFIPIAVGNGGSDTTSLISEYLQKSGAPGAIAGIFKATDPPIIITEGHSNISSSTPMNADLRFRIASNTKTLTAMTVLMHR